MSARRLRKAPRRRPAKTEKRETYAPREPGSTAQARTTVRPRTGKRGQAGRKRSRPTPEPEGSWNEIVYHRESMNMDDPADRREFVNACLQQISEAQLEMDNLEYEYRTVTAYLRDLEEIDALPKGQRQDVARHAQRILDAGRGREQFYSRDDRMAEKDFERMQELGPKTKETIDRLSQAEDYQKKIKNDLRRLDNERNSYDYRLDELDRTISSTRVLMILVAILLASVLILLFVLSRVLRWNIYYGCLLAIMFAAIGATMLYLRGQSAEKERRAALSGISRLILLQNTVKIRYVNNQNLLNYMLLKYQVKNSEELKRLAELYEKEKEERAKLRGSERTMMDSQRALLGLLRNFHLQYPEVWMRQLSGLADPREEVEIRHNLNGRRQSLRERMDYNEHQVRARAKGEIERLARDYPEYADEVLDMVARNVVPI